MKHRLGKWFAAAAATAIAMGSAPLLPHAQANHCGPIFMFSGHHAEGNFGPSANAGAGGCTLRDENVNTNFLLPGATFVSVGTTVTPVNGTGFVTIDGGAPVPLTWTWSASSVRWNSQRVFLNGGTVVTASVQSVTGVTVSNTYRAVTAEVGA
ncbi:MAG TPA: hypothetical protein VI916_11405 [Acidimicrobiia bacterium]|nr:hypothetical protein [Acidimicrobiia bacterium]